MDCSENGFSYTKELRPTSCDELKLVACNIHANIDSRHLWYTPPPQKQITIKLFIKVYFKKTRNITSFRREWAVLLWWAEESKTSNGEMNSFRFSSDWRCINSYIRGYLHLWEFMSTELRTNISGRHSCYSFTFASLVKTNKH